MIDAALADQRSADVKRAFLAGKYHGGPGVGPLIGRRLEELRHERERRNGGHDPDNQKDLDMVNSDDRRSRDLTARINEAKAKQQFPDLAPPESPPEADEVKINVDSPTTVNHNYPQPPAAVTPQKAPKLSTRLAVAAMILGGAGIGAGATTLLSAIMDRPPPAETTDNDTQFELRLVPPEENQ
jgi:hypothetical protein